MRELVTTFRDAFPAFITDQVMEKFKGLEEHILNRCVSDPENVNLTIEVLGKNGEVIRYKCARGTSQLEAFHRFLMEAIKANAMSPQLLDILVSSIVHR